MKKLLLLLLLCSSASAQLVMTNNVIGTLHMSSYDSLNSTTAAGYAGIIGGYFKATLNAVYPQFTNMIVSISTGGATMEFTVSNTIPQQALPVWAFATTNKTVPHSFILVNDNGAYVSNTVYPFLVQAYGAPASMYNGTAFTNEGLGFTSLDWFFLGANVSGNGISDTSAQSRNLASLQAMKDISKTPIDLWNDAGTNGLFSVINNNDSDWTFGGGHFTPKNAYQQFCAIWRGLALKTNLYSSIIDWATTSIASSNGITITSLSKSGNTISFNYKVDCQGPPTDLFPGMSNQITGTLWTNCPNFGSLFRETFRFTNLNPTALYTFTMDSSNVYTADGTTWMAGINFATNLNPLLPENTQKTLMLYDVRNEYGINHTNGLSTHDAGTTLPSGGDLINYGSLCFGKWPAEHGPSLVNDAAIQTCLNSMWARAIVTHNDSQPLTRAAALTQITQLQGSQLPWTHK